MRRKVYQCRLIRSDKSPLLVTIPSFLPPSPTIAKPPGWSFVPLAYLGMGWAAIRATCAAPIAPTNAARTRLGNASVIAKAVNIPA